MENLAHRERQTRLAVERRIFAKVVDGACLLGLILWSPFMPFFASAVAKDWRYVRQYAPSVSQAFCHAVAMWRAQVLSRNLLRSSWEVNSTYVKGECTHCGRCCTFNACVFLDTQADGKTQCAIYGSWLFKMLSCGDYPMTAEDIEVYDCPSFIAMPRDAGGSQRVIRIYSD